MQSVSQIKSGGYTQKYVRRHVICIITLEGLPNTLGKDKQSIKGESDT